MTLLPGADDFEASVEKSRSAGTTLDLPTGCFGDGAGLEQYRGVEFEFMLLGNRLPHGSHDRTDVQFSEVGSFDLLDDDQVLLTAGLDRKGGATGRTQRAVAFLHRQFDVLRIMVQSPDDDDVLETSGHKEFAIFQKSQVARAQERPLAR